MVSLNSGESFGRSSGFLSGKFRFGGNLGVGVGPRFANCRRIGRREKPMSGGQTALIEVRLRYPRDRGVDRVVGREKAGGRKSPKVENKTEAMGTRGEWMLLGNAPGGLKAVESAFWSWDPGWLWFLVSRKVGSTSNQFPKSAHCDRRGFALASHPLHFGAARQCLTADLLASPGDR